MSAVLPDYLQAADAVVDGARLAASRAAHIGGSADDAVDDLMRSVERAGQRRVTAQLGVTGEAGRVVLAAIVAAHAVHARLLIAGEDDTAAAVENVLPALWDGDLGRRLVAARTLASTTQHESGPAGMTELATLLRRSAGSELVPASGHLVRAVIRAGGAGLAEAWYASLGSYVLARHRLLRLHLLRPTVTNMVRAGCTPSYVATRAGLSRSTVYAWLGAETSPRAGGDDEDA